MNILYMTKMSIQSGNCNAQYNSDLSPIAYLTDVAIVVVFILSQMDKLGML